VQGHWQRLARDVQLSDAQLLQVSVLHDIIMSAQTPLAEQRKGLSESIDRLLCLQQQQQQQQWSSNSGSSPSPERGAPRGEQPRDAGAAASKEIEEEEDAAPLDERFLVEHTQELVGLLNNNLNEDM
jgi:hypothetical protein